MKPGVRRLASVVYLFYLLVLIGTTVLTDEFLLRRQEGRGAIYPILPGVFRDHEYYGHELVPGVAGTIDAHARPPAPTRRFWCSPCVRRGDH